MTIPPPLRHRDTVALLAPSGPADERALDVAAQAVEALGLCPRVYPSTRARYGYLAGPDSQRAADLNDAFADPRVAGILCARGGYGMGRILPLIDWAAVRSSPKRLFGYSDITALHLALARLGIGSFHTPMPVTEGSRGLDDFTLASLGAALFGESWGPLENPPAAPPMQTLSPGRATGRLCGGNLSLCAASLGTPWEIDTAGAVLFLEDVGEQPYRIDGMLTQLRNAGKLDACAGVLLGAFTDCTATRPERSLSLEQIFADLLVPLGKPVLSGLACGHTLPTLSLPLGARVTLDADNKELIAEE